MSDLTVNPWKRHGKDRLYVNLPDGTAVAWADRLTKVITVKVEKYRREAVALLREQLGDSATVRPSARRPGPAPAAPSVRPPQQPEPPGHRRDRPVVLPELTVADDLAENRPGAVVLEAIAARGPSSAQRLWSKMLRRASEWDSWYAGLEGERRVGRELQRLSTHGWRVLHGVPKANGGDIDHLLIGPGGVFAINTKHHQGASVWVGDTMAKVNGGQPVPYAAASKAEAAYVQRVLERHCGFAVPVEPALVFVGIVSLHRAATQYTVRIYQEREVSALAPLSGKLTPDQVERIYATARHRRAWLRP
ncbi:nuclease-related domain-containing protein [Streptomyces sp. NBC_00576]|uniref:nuclease-related domain-containing protein n=1 Tax=Streptomyces sp. NBC_00576 TaxID=2903665 RepID=UPI002E7FE968|nr:nuclease-related domain-containing protein [Streptomyces sp. NBC_00576]WUB71949.1 NERD domain-containing protein [Streptomyces sp. NBC_00576]